MNVLTKLKRSWRTFAAAPAGRRFRVAYQRQQGRKRGPLVRLGWLLAGLVLIVIGGFFMMVPGPGIPIVFLGGAFIARQSKPVARLLDALEVLLRRIVKWALRTWKKTPLVLRAALVLVVLSALGGAGWIAWQRFIVR